MSGMFFAYIMSELESFIVSEAAQHEVQMLAALKAKLDQIISEFVAHQQAKAATLQAPPTSTLTANVPPAPPGNAHPA